MSLIRKMIGMLFLTVALFLFGTTAFIGTPLLFSFMWETGQAGYMAWQDAWLNNPVPTAFSSIVAALACALVGWNLYRDRPQRVVGEDSHL